MWLHNYTNIFRYADYHAGRLIPPAGLLISLFMSDRYLSFFLPDKNVVLTG